MIGPNVRRLIAHKMSLDAIPAGGGVADGLAFLTDKRKLTEGAERATKWVEGAIQLLRNAAEPNPWKEADDETIAAHLLGQIEERRHKERERR
jgi:hypothetical protein